MPITQDDIAFLYRHARDYARPDIDYDRAAAYAEWYLDRYVRPFPDATMEDMPAHTFTFPKFRDEYEPITA